MNKRKKKQMEKLEQRKKQDLLIYNLINVQKSDQHPTQQPHSQQKLDIIKGDLTCGVDSPQRNSSLDQEATRVTLKKISTTQKVGDNTSSTQLQELNWEQSPPQSHDGVLKQLQRSNSESKCQRSGDHAQT